MVVHNLEKKTNKKRGRGGGKKKEVEKLNSENS